MDIQLPHPTHSGGYHSTITVPLVLLSVLFPITWCIYGPILDNYKEFLSNYKFPDNPSLDLATYQWELVRSVRKL